MAKTPPIDRRVARTKRTLRDALVALILERGWDTIRVQDVCDRADVGRSTFYTHFADKEELLLSGFDDLKVQLKGLAEIGKPLGFVRPLVEHAAENQRMFKALVGRRSGQVVQRRFRALVLELVAEDLAPKVDDAMVHAVAGALLELVTWAVDGRTSIDADAVIAAFQRFSGPALRELRAEQRAARPS